MQSKSKFEKYADVVINQVLDKPYNQHKLVCHIDILYYVYEDLVSRGFKVHVYDTSINTLPQVQAALDSGEVQVVLFTYTVKI